VQRVHALTQLTLKCIVDDFPPTRLGGWHYTPPTCHLQFIGVYLTTEVGNKPMRVYGHRRGRSREDVALVVNEERLSVCVLMARSIDATSAGR